jgi:hypothetical protein
MSLGASWTPDSRPVQSGSTGSIYWIDPREQLNGVLMIQLTPFNLRTGWIFKSLAYQALVDKRQGARTLPSGYRARS